MKYLKGTIGLPLILGIDDKGVIKWFVDASFAVHNYMKSHTGMFMSMGTGAAAAASSKKKLNTTSTTELELVGVNNEMPQVMWKR